MRLSSFRPRWHRPIMALSAALLAQVIATPGPVQAQGFFDQLFGGFSKPSAPQFGNGQLTPGGRAYPPGSGASPFGRPLHSPANGEDGDDRAKGGGTYQTYCVRLCDGFYFPMSASTGRKSFVVEQNRCAATCGSEARLFVSKTTNTHREAMTDLSGRPYGSLATAFKYRKELVAGCQCRAEPWAPTEVARHQSYAIAEAQTATSQRRIAQAEDLPPMPRTVAAARLAMAQEAAAAAVAQKSAQPKAEQPLPRVAAAGVGARAASTAATPGGATAAATEPASDAAQSVPSEIAPKIAAADISFIKNRKQRARSATIRTADGGQRAPQRQPRQRYAAQAQGNGGGWNVSGLTKQPKYTWPGDGPARR